MGIDNNEKKSGQTAHSVKRIFTVYKYDKGQPSLQEKIPSSEDGSQQASTFVTRSSLFLEEKIHDVIIEGKKHQPHKNQ
jgi:hypothetical protein